MSYQEWKRWMLELPWTLRWFVVLVLIRPTLDTFYYLKEISPFLSPLYIVGVLTPVLVVVSVASVKVRPQRWTFVDTAFAMWGWTVLLAALLTLVRFLSVDSLEVVLKISLPVIIYAFVRHLIRSERDLHGVLTAFLYSTIVPFGMAIYEQFAGPLGSHGMTRGYERLGGLYADVASYAMYTIGALLVVCYFFLAQPRSAPFRTHAFRLVVVGACVVLGLLSVHHTASYAVAGVLLALFVLHGATSRHVPALLFMILVLAVGYAVVGDDVGERVGRLFKTDLEVLSGEKDTRYAFHGRMSRWMYYIDYWEGMPVVAKLFGVTFGAGSKGSVRAMMLTGIHNDYLRILFSSGVLGFFSYMLIYPGLLARVFYLRSAERFLVLGGVAVVLMYSISILPTLYAPLMYLCLTIYAFAVLPQSVLGGAESPPGPLAGSYPRPGWRPRPVPSGAAIGGAEKPQSQRPLRKPAHTPVAPGMRTGGLGLHSHAPGPRAVAPLQKGSRLKRALPGGAPGGIPDGVVDAVLNEVLGKGIVDLVTAAEVALAARKHRARTDADERAVTLRVLDTALRLGLVRVGEVTSDGFQAWEGGAATLVDRVAAAWPEDLEPGFGDVCWIDLTASGLARAQEMERRQTAPSQPASRPA